MIDLEQKNRVIKKIIIICVTLYKRSIKKNNQLLISIFFSLYYSFVFYLNRKAIISMVKSNKDKYKRSFYNRFLSII